MLASALTIKTPAPGYKVPGLNAGPADDVAVASKAPVAQVRS